MKTMEINGVTFEVTIPHYENRLRFTSVWQYDGVGLESYYKRPSHIKELIWAEWKHWAANVPNICSFGISGANGFQFIITGSYTDENGQDWILYITSTRNRAILAK